MLKGALLFALWYNIPHRPTRDADLLGFGPSDIESIAQTFWEIASVEVEDGIVFDPDSVSVDEIGRGCRDRTAAPSGRSLACGELISWHTASDFGKPVDANAKAA